MAVDLEAFAEWLGAREVPNAQRPAYRRGAERIAQRAEGGPILRAHVEAVIEEERASGASPRELASLRRIGLDLLRFEQERLEGVPSRAEETYRSAPEESNTSSGTERPPVLRALLIGLTLFAVSVALVAGYRHYREGVRAPPPTTATLGTLTMLGGEKCRIAGMRFRYEYSYQRAAPPGIILLAPRASTEREFDETLHGSGIQSLTQPSIRQIRFFGAAPQPSDPQRVAYSEVEIVTDTASYSFPVHDGKLVLGDGARLWPNGPQASRTPRVAIELKTADGACPSTIDLTSAEQPLALAAVRLEFP